MFQEEMHHYYTDTERHWHRLSEPYTGADSLLTLLRDGGQIVGKMAYCEYFPLSQARLVRVYHIYVKHCGLMQHMKIINSPYLQRLLIILQIQVHHLESDISYAMAMQHLERNRLKVR